MLYACSREPSSIPFTADAKNGLVMSGTTTPMLRVTPDLRLRAMALGEYSKALTASSMASADRTVRPLRCRETVAGETPARLATSWIFAI